MLNELNALESKIAQVAALCRALRTENADLRQKLASSESERQQMAERMEQARGRLEQLALKLPDTEA